MQNTHFSEQFRRVHAAVMDIVAVVNRPQGDEKLIRAASIPLERALFPLLVLIERLGPIGVGDLADRIGRDYSTVSRQVARLESLELIVRRPKSGDRRITEALIAPKGKAMTDAVDAARDDMGRALFASWAPEEIEDLARLMRKFADTMKAGNV